MLLRRTVAILLAGLAYVLGTHWLMTRPPSPWNVVGVLSPMLAAIAVGAWRGGQRVPGALAALALAALCAMALTGTEIAPAILYLAQHAGVHAFLAIGFGSTLRAGHTPLITTLARRVHGGTLTPGMTAYTRSVTLAWVLYFVAMVALSIGLFAFASFQTWAVFANLLTPIAMVLMFGGEYLLRYRLHPEFERSSIADAIRSYMRGSAA
ncbi:MAG TPA: hypothetical protein VGM74_21010 [Burkholderiaceae bacterium]|jgi:uncharacterized membrane protein